MNHLLLGTHVDPCGNILLALLVVLPRLSGSTGAHHSLNVQLVSTGLQTCNILIGVEVVSPLLAKTKILGTTRTEGSTFPAFLRLRLLLVVLLGLIVKRGVRNEVCHIVASNVAGLNSIVESVVNLHYHGLDLLVATLKGAEEFLCLSNNLQKLLVVRQLPLGLFSLVDSGLKLLPKLNIFLQLIELSLSGCVLVG